MQLSYNQKMQLIENGYVVIPGVVPKVMVNEALKAVNHAIGRGIPENHHGANYSKDLQLERHPAIADLFNKTPAKTLIDNLVGENSYYPISGAQIALRFPNYQDPPNPYAGAHLDGMLKLKEGIVENFTALVGILLSDQTETNMGNFIVYPGSHRLCEQHLQKNGPDILLTEEIIQTKHRPMGIQLPEPVQITGQAGDVIITHYQMIHAGGPNTSPFIRYSCYYRVSHSEIRNDWRAPLTNMWMHWPGLQDVLQNKES